MGLFDFLKKDKAKSTEVALKRDEDDGVQFSHTTVEHLNALLSAGFMLTDIYEDTNGEGRLHELNIPTFTAIRVIKS